MLFKPSNRFSEEILRHNGIGIQEKQILAAGNCYGLIVCARETGVFGIGDQPGAGKAFLDHRHTTVRAAVVYDDDLHVQSLGRAPH